MDASDEPVSPPASSDQLPLNQHMAMYPHFKVSRRKSRGSRMKPSQIHSTQSPEHPDSKSQLVLYDNSPESKRQKRAAVNDFYDSAEMKSSALERAEDFRATLPTDMPSFAKTLVRSNVTVGFWMHLPMRFCKSHLPKTDTTVLVENEIGAEYVINYIAERTALSGGWKAFCAAHKLAEGDVLVFQMVKPLQFKVYVVRGNGSSAKVEEDDFVQDTYSRRKQMITVKESAAKEETEYSRTRKRTGSPLVSLSRENNNEENGLVASEKTNGNPSDHSEKSPENPISENMEIVASSEPALDFMDIRCIEDFTIVVNDMAIDSELSEHHRKKYYELCSSQKAILHRNLLNSINCKLAAEIISGTVDIAEAIRSSSLSSSHGEYAVWEKTLKGFQFLGMKVGFLCERLDKLIRLAMESEAAVESERREVQMRQARVSEEMESLELKLTELKETRKKLDEEIETLKVTAERHEVMFQEVVNAPW
ncbi:B3 domain-containing protein Os01g0234100 [Linum perenne]